MISVEQFTNIVNIVFIVLFVLFFVGLLIAGLIGFKRGVIKESYYFIFTAIFLGVGICLLPLVANLLGKMSLSFLPYKSIEMTNTSTGQIYYVKITNLNETIQNCFMGYYKLFNVIDAEGNVMSSADAYNYAVALTSSIIKLLSFFIIILVFTLIGMLLACILWHALFKRLLPRIVRKKVKVRAVSTIEAIVRYVVVSFLLISPLSSIINVVNKSYTRSKDTSNETVQYLNAFMDTYNNSLFANTFFNWTVNEDGLTLDAQVMESITKTAFNEGSLGIISSINDLTQVASTVIEGFTFSDEDGNATFKFDYTILFAKDVLDNFLTALRDSKIVVYALPIAAEMALNSDLLTQFIDRDVLKDVNLKDIDWANEIALIQEIGDNILDSGVIDKFKTADGTYDFGAEPVTYVKSLLADSAIENNKKALEVIDKSDLLSKVAIPVMFDMFTKQSPDLANFLPTLEESKNIKWGFEFSTLLDILHRINKVDDTLIDVIFEEEKTTKSITRNEEAEEKTKQDKIIEKLLAHIKDYNEILTGTLDEYGYPIDINDNDGLSNKGIYNLLDLELARKPIRYGVINYVGDLLFPADENKETRKNELKNKFDEMDIDKWRINYKKEFHQLFDILTPFKDHSDIFNDVLNGNIIESDLEQMSQTKINVLSKAIKKFDNSDLSYVVLMPLIEDSLLSDSMASTYESMGLDMATIKKGFEYCKANKICGQEISNLVTQLKNIDTITNSINKATSTTEMISKLGNNSNKIILVLDTIYLSKLINFSDEKQAIAKDSNFNNLMNYVFESAKTDGFKYKQSELPSDIVWANDLSDNKNEIGHFVKFIEILGEKNILDAFNDPELFSTNAKIKELVTKYNLTEVIAAISDSYVISATMGDFLDAQLANSGMIDKNSSVTFNNLDKEDWKKESETLKDILTIIGNSQIQFNNLSLDALNDIVGLNNLFHSLSESQIFIDKTTNKYLLSDWILAKLKPSLQAINFGGKSIDIAKDPEVWDSSSWGDEDKSNDYSILEKDFLKLDTLESWNSGDYSYDFDTSKYVNSSYTNYWDNPNFYTDYSNTLKDDEINKIVDVVYWVNKLSAEDFTTIEPEELNSLLTSINNTSTLRICIYNMYNSLNDLITSNYFDFSAAYNNYLIDCDTNNFADVSASRSKRQTEIGYLIDIFNCYKEIDSKGIINTDGSFDSDKIDENFIDSFKTTLKGLNSSNVFHRKGSFKDEGDGKYYPSCFQQMVTKFLSSYDMRAIIYSEESPKDKAYQDAYLNADRYFPHNEVTPEEINNDKDIKIKLSKIDYLVDTLFNPLSEETNFTQQEKELDACFEVVLALIGGGSYQGFTKEDGSKTLNFTRISINDENITAINEVLNAMLKSEIFKDCVPNAIDVALNRNLTGLVGVNLTDASPYYFYKDASGEYDDNKTFDVQEIDNICNVLSDYVDFQEIVSNEDITSIPVLKKLIEGDNSVLKSLLKDLNQSYIFHKFNDNLTNPTNPTKLTVFEQTIKMLLDQSGIYKFIYKFDYSNPDAITNLMIQNIKAKTDSEIKFNKGNVPSEPQTYNDTWYQISGPNEIDSIINFLKVGIDIQKDSVSFDSENIDMTSLSPSQIKDILFAMNQVDLLKDGTPRVVERGFISIGISSFTTYKFTPDKTQNLAYYKLHPFIYGGDRDNIGGTNTEIYRIYEILENMANYDTTSGDKVFRDYKTINSLKAFTDSCDNINGLFSFVTNSHILNTYEGTFNKKWPSNTDGISLSTRGLLFYNALNQNEEGKTENLTKYVSGSTVDEKIYALSSIFDLNGEEFDTDYFDEKAEANAIYNLANISNSVMDIDTDSYVSVMTNKYKIDLAIHYSYDAYIDGSNKRSYLASDIVSNLIQSAIDKEQSKLDDKSYYKSLRIASNYKEINKDSYSLLNETERTAINACFDASEYIDKVGANTETLTREKMNEIFTRMGTSDIAKILYLSEMHEPLSIYCLKKGKFWNYVTDITNENSKIYASDFNFLALSNAYCDTLGI